MLKVISLTYRIWKRKRDDRVKRLYRQSKKPTMKNDVHIALQKYKEMSQ